MKTNRHNVFRRATAGALTLTLAFGPIGGTAYAQLTPLADVPIAAKVAAKPNIVYTVDDSGSMRLNFLPDFVIGNYCRNANGRTVGACATGSPPAFSFLGTSTPMHAAEFNKLYYNPDVTYEPPYDGAGRQWPTAGATYYSQTAGNTSNWTRTRVDPYLLPAPPNTAANSFNLASPVAVTMWCNSDFPNVDNTAASMGAAIGVNGEYVPGDGKGEDCRINGRAYDAVNGAPAVADGYNYPWRKTSGADDDPTHFWRNGGSKTIWCNLSAAGRPRNPTPTCTYACTLGGTVTFGPPQVQTCVAGSTGSTGGPPYTYSPVGCETNPAYQWTWAVGGCVGTIGVECLACNRSGTSVVTTRNGSCSITGAACGTSSTFPTVAPPIVVNGNPACPDAPSPIPTGCTTGVLVPTCNYATLSNACNRFVWDPMTNTPTATTLFEDANLTNGGTGSVCRRNNFAGYGSGRYTYPSAGFTTGISGNTGAAAGLAAATTRGCPAMPTTVNVPRHYYNVASVEFCAAQDNTNHIQWRGFGTGACQTKNDFGTHIHPKYGAFTRVSLINDGRIFNHTDPVTGAATTRTFDQEMTNYANWYAFYRTRILAAKTTSSVAFNLLDNTYRVGFHVFNTPLTKWVNVNDFDAAQRATWYATLTSVDPATGSQTPTLDASLRIGDLFQNGAGSAGLPPHTDPITPGVTCQSNYHILFTDGYTNQPTLPTVVGQVDGGTVPVFPPDPDPVNRPEITLSTLRGLVGSPWPNPYRDTTGIANSLSDIALHYWMNDLRPGLTNNVPSGDGRAGGDVDPNVDVAWWQHVNFSAISFGSEGILDASNVTPTVAAIASGAQPWFTAPNLPAPPNKPAFPASNQGATAVDDLWHATVNARGKFVYAKTPLEVAYGLGSILAGISNNRKARVGASFSGRALSATNNFVFQATIEPGWTGELKRVRVDPTSAVELPYVSPPDWSAALNLNTLLQTPVVAPALDTDNPWFLNRRIVTRDASGNAVPFRYASLSGSQLATLASTPIQQQKVIAYLRGGSTFGNGPTPQAIEGTNIGQFRKRLSKLGDLSNSKPVVIGQPNNSWSDSTDPGYSAFKAAQAGRAMRIFVGANDGMLHSFDADNGNEVFAYIPSALFNSFKDDGGKNDRGIHALTYQDGGAPIFKHHMYVDGSPRSTDVDLSGGAGTDWRTILVGGLGKGGNMYYALDVTSPAAATEATAAAKILWEFSLPGSAVSYGRPIIAKTRAHGWVVIIASGYNSTANSGRGRLYFLSVVDGSILKTMDTPIAADIGTVLSPSGFTQISGFTKDYRNQTIEQVYGGDLNGRLWRFDVSDPVAANWTAVHFATLTDPGGVPQPITTPPQIEIDLNNGTDRYVFIGTGRLLDTIDLTSPFPAQTQTMYAFRDGTLTTPSTAGLPIVPRGTMAVAGGINAIAGGAPNGWYEDLAGGQRIVTDVVADLNVVAYVGTDIQPDPCLTSLPAYIYAREYVSAKSLIEVGGVPAPFAFASEGAVGIELVGLDSPTSSFPVMSLVYSKETTGGLAVVKIVNPNVSGGHRLSWRLIGQ